MRDAVTFQFPKLILGLIAIALWSAFMFYLGANGPVWIQILAAPAFVVPIASLTEWLVHGFIYHSKAPGLSFINKLHNGHHWVVFPPARYFQTETKYKHMRFRPPTPPFQMADNWWDEQIGMYSQVLLHFVTGMPLVLIPAWLLTGSVPFCASVAVSGTAIAWVVAYTHGVMHTPRDRWIEKQFWFQFLDRHHYIHHCDTRVNVNFMMPICDVLFGSLRLRMTAEELQLYPTFEEAKPVAWDVKTRGKQSAGDESLPRPAAGLT